MMAPNLNSYDYVVVAFSGGKDSLACFLHLIDLGVDRSRIELWHHDVDGREGSQLMDWPVTRSYCRSVADAFGVPIYFSWKVGGFEGEMLRENCLTAPIRFETPEGETKQVGGLRGKASTRRMFPQVSADLSVRWCSAYLKIDVCTAAINNQDRFRNKRTLVITGERAEESPGRARYSEFEPHKADNRDGKKVVRWVDQWRPVHQWSEQEVWDLIERYRVNPHPAYRLGWGRVSCATCIFGSPNQWASILEIDPEKVSGIAVYEARFDKTINRKLSVLELAEKGMAYDTMAPHDVRAALSEKFDEPVIVDHWRLPAGAFGESCGPV
jgi:3'-phosphoadenosine 5'-phosphosulfate sulfotransferase (PAPS reductase)/FAD synthetase